MPWVFSGPLCWYRSRLDEQQTAPACRKCCGGGSISPRGKFFHNKPFLGTDFWLMGSQTTASPFMAPFLLHIQITTVLGIPPASHNAMATRRIMCNLESFNFLPWLSSAASPAAQQRTQSPAQSSAGLPATTAGIALSRAGRHWKQPVTPSWGSLDPSSPPALMSTGILPISALGVSSERSPWLYTYRRNQVHRATWISPPSIIEKK